MPQHDRNDRQLYPGLLRVRVTTVIRVTETWSDRRPTSFAFLAGKTMGIDDIAAHNNENINRTLANLTTAAKQPR